MLLCASSANLLVMVSSGTTPFCLRPITFHVGKAGPAESDQLVLRLGNRNAALPRVVTNTIGTLQLANATEMHKLIAAGFIEECWSSGGR